ncbi:MAG: hypothetical protein JW892_02685 [Anaerolineae bacterium]|nr:hypothetical protein [Anaerolineae bacterium]
MNDLARQKLCELLQQRQAIRSKKGHDPVSHARTCQRRLEDLCGGDCLTEINVLTAAVRDQIPESIEAWPHGAPVLERLDQLAAQLAEHWAMREEAARWAVMAWAEALGVLAAETLESEPAADPAPDLDAEPAAEPESGPELPVLFSTWKMQILVRSFSAANTEWVEECEMPPAFLPMPDEEIGIRPLGLNYTQIELWARSFRMPELICYLDLSDRLLFDSSLEYLTVFTQLRELNLAETLVTGEGLAFLKDLPLTWLRLAECRNLSDKGLQRIASLVHLETLDLSYCTGITGRGLAHDKPLEHLRVLNLERCSTLQEATLASLAAMPALEDLDLSDTQIDGMGFMHFRNNTTLRRLSLEGCARLNSRTVPHLLNLEALEVLHLGRTFIEDADLELLMALRNLRELHLYGCTKVTTQEVARLRARGLRVFYGSDSVILE